MNDVNDSCTIASVTPLSEIRVNNELYCYTTDTSQVKTKIAYTLQLHNA